MGIFSIHRSEHRATSAPGKRGHNLPPLTIINNVPEDRYRGFTIELASRSDGAIVATVSELGNRLAKLSVEPGLLIRAGHEAQLPEDKSWLGATLEQALEPLREKYELGTETVIEANARAALEQARLALIQ